MKLSLLLLTSATLCAASGSGRGIGASIKMMQEEDLKLLSSLSWFYNWGLDPPSEDGFPEEFVAMAWGRKSVDKLSSWTPHRSTKTILGFNEPNVRKQANMSPEEACNLWPQVLAAAKKYGLRVGSPAANHCNPHNGKECTDLPFDWFDKFFSQPGCGTDTTDFIATHKYGCNATATLEYVKELHSRYKKPVWLTEFSCAAALPAAHLEFMKEILPELDAMKETVERYAWFAARTDPEKQKGGLISGSQLTECGEFYTSTVGISTVSPPGLLIAV